MAAIIIVSQLRLLITSVFRKRKLTVGQLCLSELPQVYSVVSRNCRNEPDISPLQISFLQSYQNQTYIKESL